MNEGINVQSDGSFLLKVGELILESGKYFAFAGESRHELYRDLSLEQKGQQRSNEYAFDVFIYDDSNDVYSNSKTLYGEFKITVESKEKIVIFEHDYESVDFEPVIENIPVDEKNGGLWDHGRIENGFPSIHVPSETNHLRHVSK